MQIQGAKDEFELFKAGTDERYSGKLSAENTNNLQLLFFSLQEFVASIKYLIDRSRVLKVDIEEICKVELKEEIVEAEEEQNDYQLDENIDSSLLEPSINFCESVKKRGER